MTNKLPTFIDGRKLCRHCKEYYPANGKFFGLKRDKKTLQDKCMGCAFLQKHK